MVSSDGTYQLSFTGDVSQIAVNFDWNAEILIKTYKSYFLKENVETNFLKFLEKKCNIKGIEFIRLIKIKQVLRKF